MANAHISFLTKKNLNTIIDKAIAAEIGDIEALPPEVSKRTREVYGEFIPIYAEMVRIKNDHPIDWQPETITIDPEVLKGMLHFFSDYQHLTRRFQQINRQVKHLLTLDRHKEAHRYDECVAEIVSGKQGSSLMQSIINS